MAKIAIGAAPLTRSSASYFVRKKGADNPSSFPSFLGTQHQPCAGLFRRPAGFSTCHAAPQDAPDLLLKARRETWSVPYLRIISVTIRGSSPRMTVRRWSVGLEQSRPRELQGDN